MAVAIDMSATLPHKRLRALLQGIATVATDMAVVDIALDSRKVTPGALFVALPGLRVHGLSFAAQAIANGACAVLYEPTGALKSAVPSDAAPMIAVPNLATMLGAIADRFFDAPSAALQVIGVTGTNGKTTSAYLLAQALGKLGRAAAYAGTLGFGHVDALQTSTHTTPDCISVHRLLASMRDAGDRFVGMEVSSHALDQRRIDGVRVHTALFTNLTRDHLDYHGTVEAYGAAKEKLFHRDELRHAAVNADDTFGRELLTRLAGRAKELHLTAFGTHADCRNFGTRQLIATQVDCLPSGLSMAIDGSFGARRMRSPLIGAFNAENILGVLAVLLGFDVTLEEAVRALEQCEAPPGRMETVSQSGKPLIVIDYAHTPDALAKALQTARAHARGKLLCVFGCGGDRDAGKRPLMGGIAERNADVVILTDDNPRTEDSAAIVADISRGMAANTAIVERDRAAAIALAIAMASMDDVVLIAGKGHEEYQIVGGESRHFSDRETALGILRSAP